MTKVLKIVSTLGFLLFSANVFAQFYLGPKAGINYATVNGLNLPSGSSTGNILGLQGGAVGELDIVEMVSIQAELAFVQKGYTSDMPMDSVSDVRTESEYKFNYVDFSGMIKLKFGGQGPGLYVVGGPFFGFNLGGNVNQTTTSPSGSNTVKRKIDLTKEKYQANEMGLFLGLGFHLPVGDHQFFIDARYQFGLTTITEIDPLADPKNSGLQLSTGILFFIAE